MIGVSLLGQKESSKQRKQYSQAKGEKNIEVSRKGTEDKEGGIKLIHYLCQLCSFPSWHQPPYLSYTLLLPLPPITVFLSWPRKPPALYLGLPPLFTTS